MAGRGAGRLETGFPTAARFPDCVARGIGARERGPDGETEASKPAASARIMACTGIPGWTGRKAEGSCRAQVGVRVGETAEASCTSYRKTEITASAVVGSKAGWAVVGVRMSSSTLAPARREALRERRPAGLRRVWSCTRPRSMAEGHLLHVSAADIRLLRSAGKFERHCS